MMKVEAREALAAVVHAELERTEDEDLWTIALTVVDRLTDSVTLAKTTTYPRGFRTSLTIEPVPEPTVLAGVTLFQGVIYTVKTRTYGSGKERTFRRMRYRGSRWGNPEFVYPSGTRRSFFPSDVIEVTADAP